MRIGLFLLEEVRCLCTPMNEHITHSFRCKWWISKHETLCVSNDYNYEIGSNFKWRSFHLPWAILKCRITFFNFNFNEYSCDAKDRPRIRNKNEMRRNFQSIFNNGQWFYLISFYLFFALLVGVFFLFFFLRWYMILLCLLINCICGLKSLSKYKTQMGVYSFERKVFKKKWNFRFVKKKRENKCNKKWDTITHTILFSSWWFAGSRWRWWSSFMQLL